MNSNKIIVCLAERIMMVVLISVFSLSFKLELAAQANSDTMMACDSGFVKYEIEIFLFSDSTWKFGDSILYGSLNEPFRGTGEENEPYILGKTGIGHGFLIYPNMKWRFIEAYNSDKYNAAHKPKQEANGHSSSSKGGDGNSSPQRSYQSKSTSRQCSGRTQKGARCQRMTTSPSGRCYQH